MPTPKDSPMMIEKTEKLAQGMAEKLRAHQGLAADLTKQLAQGSLEGAAPRMMVKAKK